MNKHHFEKGLHRPPFWDRVRDQSSAVSTWLRGKRYDSSRSWLKCLLLGFSGENRPSVLNPKWRHRYRSGGLLSPPPSKLQSCIAKSWQSKCAWVLIASGVRKPGMLTWHSESRCAERVTCAGSARPVPSVSRTGCKVRRNRSRWEFCWWRNAWPHRPHCKKNRYCSSTETLDNLLTENGSGASLLPPPPTHYK